MRGGPFERLLPRPVPLHCFGEGSVERGLRQTEALDLQAGSQARDARCFLPAGRSVLAGKRGREVETSIAVTESRFQSGAV